VSVDADPRTGAEPDPDDKPAYAPQTGGPMGRMVAPGMPLERSKDFRGTLRRLGSRLTPDLPRIVAVVVLTISGVLLSAFGPRILGERHARGK